MTAAPTLPLDTSSPSTTSERPALTIVLLSTGSAAECDSACNLLLPAARLLAAQCVFVTSDVPRADRWRGAPETVVVQAGEHASRAELATLGARHARGNIVLFREDRHCSDLEWLAPHAARLGVELAPSTVADEAAARPSTAAATTGARRRRAAPAGV